MSWTIIHFVLTLNFDYMLKELGYFVFLGKKIRWFVGSNSCHISWATFIYSYIVDINLNGSHFQITISNILVNQLIKYLEFSQIIPI